MRTKCWVVAALAAFALLAVAGSEACRGAEGMPIGNDVSRATCPGASCGFPGYGHVWGCCRDAPCWCDHVWDGYCQERGRRRCGPLWRGGCVSAAGCFSRTGASCCDQPAGAHADSTP
jgi:hypothetical protein